MRKFECYGKYDHEELLLFKELGFKYTYNGKEDVHIIYKEFKAKNHTFEIILNAIDEAPRSVVLNYYINDLEAFNKNIENKSTYIETIDIGEVYGSLQDLLDIGLIFADSKGHENWANIK